MKFEKTRAMIWALIIVVGLFVLLNTTACVFTHQKSFGRLSSGERLERIKESPNYRDGAFHNLEHTPALTEGVKPIDMAKDMMFKRSKRNKTKDKIPAVKTDLKSLDSTQDVLVWFGHSSYFLQVDGKRMLIDPVFCGHAAPVSFMMKEFDGTDIYKVDDMPQVDYLFITHDHWDHLDYKTVTAMKERIGTIVCGLGVGEHFERWGFDVSDIVELDWNEESALSEGFTAISLPTRHFAGRSQKSNTSLWSSYLLQTPSMKIFIGGDGGYGTHFTPIGERFGEIDLALLENGQYDRKWRYIHAMPEEVVKIAAELRAKAFIPGHSAKFALSGHAWDEPLIRVTAAFDEAIADSTLNYAPKILTPMIGEPVYVKDSAQTFERWWEGVQ